MKDLANNKGDFMMKIFIGLVFMSSPAFADGDLYHRYRGRTLIIDYAYTRTGPVFKKKYTWCEERNGEKVAVARISVLPATRMRGYYYGTEIKTFRFSYARLCGGVSRIIVNGKEYLF